MQRPLHILLQGVDDSVLLENAASDTRKRLENYANILNQHRPKSHLSYLALSSKEYSSPGQLNEQFSLQTCQYRNRSDMPKLWKQLHSIHQERSIDLISNQNLAGEGHLILRFAKQNNIPIVGQIHYDFFSPQAIQELYGKSILGKLRYALAKWSIKKYTALRVVSNNVALQLKSLYPSLAIQTIPVAVSLPHYTQAKQTSEPLVLFVGRFVEAKNLKFWLQVAKSVQMAYPPARFSCVGDGPLFKEIKAYAKQLQFKHPPEFTGARRYEDLIEDYRKARVLLLTSTNEGFGRVLVEAAYQQTPSVCSNINGIRDIIEHEKNGFLIKTNDLESFSKAVQYLLRDEALSKLMGKNAYDSATHRFAPCILSEQWVQYLIQWVKD